jgi:tetraacyldisaccharide-1-P 4'-kinase
LLEAADVVAVVRDERGPEPVAIEAGAQSMFEVISRIDRAHDPDGREVALGNLGARVGLLVAVARPERIANALFYRGIQPAATIAFGDHDQPSRAALERRIAGARPVDAWLTTAKCATKLPNAILGTRVFVLDYQVELPPGLISALVDA